MRKVHNRLNWSCLIIGASLFSLLATPAHTQNPPGSYQNSCFGIYPNAVGNVLAATCQMTSGQWQWTALPNFSQCIGDITNFDGTLGCNIGGQPPSGSYTQTCRFSWVNGTALNAECKTTSGQWQRTQLQNFNQCLQPPANLDGALVCKMAGQPPSGSYTQTCRSAWVDGNTLIGECQTTSGQWQWTTLPNFSQCIGDIANFDGTLACNIGGQPPTGGYTFTCRFAWVNGTTLNAECQTPSGQWQWKSMPNFKICPYITDLGPQLTCGTPFH